MGNIVPAKVAQIRIMFIINPFDLNDGVFNESIGYHVLPDYGLQDRYLRRLQFEVRGSMFHNFQMTRSRLGIDLEEAFMFQKKFTSVICYIFDACFSDNDLISCFKILNLINMPLERVGLHNWCVQL